MSEFYPLSKLDAKEMLVDLRGTEAPVNSRKNEVNISKGMEEDITNPGMGTERGNCNCGAWLSGPGLPPKLKLRFFIAKTRASSPIALAVMVRLV